jgi:tetratricopeptide (TPR) repeat protein
MHYAEQAVLRGDSVTAHQAVDRYIKLTGDAEATRYIELAIPITLGTDAQAAAAIKEAANLPLHSLDNFNGTFATRHDHLDRDLAMDSLFAVMSHTNRSAMRMWYPAAMAQVSRADSTALNAQTSPSSRAQYFSFAYLVWNQEPPANVLEIAACPPAQAICWTLVGAGDAALGRWADQAKLISSLRTLAAAEKDTTAARKMLETAELMRGIGLSRRGDLNGARPILQRFAPEANMRGAHARYELAILESQAKHPDEALRNFNSIKNTLWRAPALLGSAMMHEQLRQLDEARADYRRFLTVTAKGDQSIAAIVSARAAYARLGGKG